MSIEQLIDGLLKREGGYVDHADDAGGPTKYGITEAEARRNGWAGAIQDITEEFARQVYRTRYWTEPGFDKIASVSPEIAEELLDTGVNMGTETASRFLQRALNALNIKGEMFPDAPVDGMIGPKTISALTSFMAKRSHEGVEVLLKALNCLQGARYIELCEKREANESFLYGWLRERIGL